MVVDFAKVCADTSGGKVAAVDRLVCHGGHVRMPNRRTAGMSRQVDILQNSERYQVCEWLGTWASEGSTGVRACVRACVRALCTRARAVVRACLGAGTPSWPNPGGSARLYTGK